MRGPSPVVTWEWSPNVTFVVRQDLAMNLQTRAIAFAQAHRPYDRIS
jgi:hypothetical protein